MTGRIITVAQQKGGAGKTTLAAQLAAHWAGSGHAVAIVDIDPQASLSAWAELRAANADLAPLHLSRITGWRTEGEVRRLADAYDLVVVDSPPHADTEAGIAVRAADLVLAPVQLSPMDVWAAKATLDLAAREKRTLLMVLNRVPPRAKLAEPLIAELQGLGAAVARARLGNRTAFAVSMMQGRGVSELPRGGKAAAEIKALASEVLRRSKRSA